MNPSNAYLDSGKALSPNRLVGMFLTGNHKLDLERDDDDPDRCSWRPAGAVCRGRGPLRGMSGLLFAGLAYTAANVVLVGTAVFLTGHWMPHTVDQIGRASCRERVCQYV